MREMLCFHWTEAKSFVPSLEIGVLCDDGDTDCLGSIVSCYSKHMLDEGFANTLSARFGENRKPLKIEGALVRSFKSNAAESLPIHFSKVIGNPLAEVIPDPFQRIVGRVCGAVLRCETESFRHIQKGATDNVDQELAVVISSCSDLHIHHPNTSANGLAAERPAKSVRSSRVFK